MWSFGKFFLERWETAVCKIKQKSGMLQNTARVVRACGVLRAADGAFQWGCQVVLVSLFKEGLFLFANVFFFFLDFFFFFDNFSLNELEWEQKIIMIIIIVIVYESHGHRTVITCKVTISDSSKLNSELSNQCPSPHFFFSALRDFCENIAGLKLKLETQLLKSYVKVFTLFKQTIFWWFILNGQSNISRRYHDL